jgi:hypothetical protein
MIQKDETHTATQPKPEHLLHRSKRTKNQAALGLLGKTPSVLQSILPLQAQRKSLAYSEGRTDDLSFRLGNFQEFYRKEGGSTDWATLTRLLGKGVFGEIIWCW